MRVELPLIRLRCTYRGMRPRQRGCVRSPRDRKHHEDPGQYHRALAVNRTSIITFRAHSREEDIQVVLLEFRRANPGRRLIVVLDNLSREYAVNNAIYLVYQRGMAGITGH